MIKWAIIFFIISVVAGFFGFTGVASGARTIAKVLFLHRARHLPDRADLRRPARHPRLLARPGARRVPWIGMPPGGGRASTCSQPLEASFASPAPSWPPGGTHRTSIVAIVIPVC